MILSPAFRRLALIVHIGFSVGQLGAVAAFLVLAIIGLGATDPQIMRAAYVSMDLIARLLIVPMVIMAPLSGIVLSLGTRWGLLQHWWIVAKLLISIIVAVVMLLQLKGIGFVADAAGIGQGAFAAGPQLRTSFVLHASAGLLVLLIPMGLSIYKPAGLTRYGWRKRHNAATLT